MKRIRNDKYDFYHSFDTIYRRISELNLRLIHFLIFKNRQTNIFCRRICFNFSNTMRLTPKKIGRTFVLPIKLRLGINDRLLFNQFNGLV